MLLGDAQLPTASLRQQQPTCMHAWRQGHPGKLFLFGADTFPFTEMLPPRPNAAAASRGVGCRRWGTGQQTAGFGKERSYYLATYPLVYQARVQGWMLTRDCKSKGNVALGI